MKEEEVDVLIIGAGPSGSVAAALLQQQGHKVKIIEKNHFPRFVIGESLLPRCMFNLEKAGFLPALMREGFQIKRGATFIHIEEENDFLFSDKFSKGWDWTWQVKRDRFDHVLAQEVEKKGVAVEYDTEVVSTEFFDDHSSLTTVSASDKKKEIKARFILDASGFGRVLAKELNLDCPSGDPVRSALFCHVRPEKIYRKDQQERILIIVHEKSTWGWVIPFSDNSYSIGIVGFPEDIMPAKDHSLNESMKKWIELIPALKKRFTNAPFSFEPRIISGYSSASTKTYGNGFALAGNAFGFVDPIFSSGVTLATESGAVAARLINDQLRGIPVDWGRDYEEYIYSGVAVFRTFIEKWYTGELQRIIFAKNPSHSLKRQICSILAGYVWDRENPFVKNHRRALNSLTTLPMFRNEE